MVELATAGSTTVAFRGTARVAPVTTLDLHGLGVRTRVTVSGEGSTALLDALRTAWSRCLSPRGGEVAGSDLALSWDGGDGLAPLLQRFTQDVTTEAIKAQRGRLFMFHAGAVSDPASGATLAYVAPGGTGKTTLSQVLGRTHGYVTDETVGFTPDGRILPYEKPLSVRPGNYVGVKDETSPDDLGLAHVHPAPTLRRFVLIRRDESLAAPTVEELSVVDAIIELASESSSLSALPDPLQTLAAFLEERPPVLRVTYAEAAHARDVLVAALEES